jgi:glycosyltransferase involved in cell wall biosynthesis
MNSDIPNNIFPLVTIATLSFNNSRLVVKTLECIKNQTYPNFEHIIIDDFSNDDSVQVIQDWIIKNNYSCIFIKHSENKGIIHSLNEILSLSKGEYFTGNSDDLWDKDHVEKHIEILKETKDSTAVLYSKSRVFNFENTNFLEDLDPIKNSRQCNYPFTDSLFFQTKPNLYLLRSKILNDHLFWTNPVIAISAFIKISVLKSKGGWSNNYFFEDYPLWFSLSMKYDFLYLDQCSSTYILHSNSVSSKYTHRINKDILKMLVSNASKCSNHKTREVLMHRLLTLSKQLQYSTLQRLKLGLTMIKMNIKFAVFINNWV